MFCSFLGIAQQASFGINLLSFDPNTTELLTDGKAADNKRAAPNPLHKGSVIVVDL